MMFNAKQYCFSQEIFVQSAKNNHRNAPGTIIIIIFHNLTESSLQMKNCILAVFLNFGII